MSVKPDGRPISEQPVAGGHLTDDVDTWAEVEDWIAERSRERQPHEPRAKLVYRGSRADRRLESSLLRRGAAYARREQHLLGVFRRYAYRSGRPEWSDWEWLALAQHHGLPTRLLDFTFSPLIALHFATLRHQDEPSLLWAVDYQKVHDDLPRKLREVLNRSGSTLFGTEQLVEAAKKLSDFDAMASDGEFAVFWEPPSIDERIVNQSAVFCVMSSATGHFDDWLRKRPDKARLLKLSPKAKAEARAHLDLVGITERLLFPDLTGLAAWIARYYE